MSSRVEPSPASEDEFRAPIDALPDPVFMLAARRNEAGDVVDLDYRFVNEAGLRLYRRSRDEVIGHTQLELFPSVRDSDIWTKYLEVLESGSTARIGVPWFDENGVVGSFELSFARYGDGLIVEAKDVTDRMRLEEQMRVERQQLRYQRDFNDATLGVAGALIMVVDSSMRILRFNRQCEVVTGYREAEVLGRHPEFLLPPSERVAALANVEPTSPDHPVSQVNHWLTKAGELRMIRWSNAALVDAAGNRSHLISVGIDITDQERAEVELARRAHDLEVANRELARSNADLEEFAYIASHDLLEPLRAISLPIEYVATKYQGQLDAKAEEFLNYAIDGSHRLQRLINDLLTYSRVGRIEGELRPTDADQVARQAIEALGPALVSARAVVTVEPLPTVLADPDQLGQVFRNLIGNAVKFVGPGVQPRVTVSADTLGCDWCFRVTDNGIGIPADQRESIFTMFQRLQPPDAYPGTGIGLAIVKKIVQRHGGEIGVEDAPGGSGCRFWFTLPADGRADR